ncbi:MAG: DNA replication/repair protein RecF [Bacillota bacterium]|nr:DNA replication/repair protein RecF [Bacillota bacterium]
MIITGVTLQNFRNFEETKVDFDPVLNMIVGDNAQGKTTLIEAIFVAAFGKSFRGAKDSEMVRFGSEYARVRVDYCKERYGPGHVEYRIKSDGSKSFRVNGVGITKLSALLGNMGIVLFHPEDLRLIKDGPGERRAFLNREISNLSLIYCNDLIEYNRILGQRNALLKMRQVDPDQIAIWDEQLAERATKIVRKRLQYLEKLNRSCLDIHRSITRNEEIDVRYLGGFDFDAIDQYRDFMMQRLKISLSMDIKRGYTGFGPHRDDLEVRIGGKPAKVFASQGQQRTAALSLKLSEIQIIRDETGENPILLLDDVMSELDLKRQTELIRAFADTQVILTTTDVTHIIDAFARNSRQITVDKGKIKNGRNDE